MTSRAFLYGRHSTDKQDITEDVQYALCLRYYEQELLPKGVLLATTTPEQSRAGWFYDEAITSAISLGERHYGRIVMCSLQPGDHLVTAKHSRTFRSVRDGANTIAQLEQRGVRVHVVDLPIDSTKASGRLFRNVTLSMDQYLREIAVEHQNELMNYRKANGLPYSRGVPIGWKVQGDKPHRVFRVDMQERELVEKIWELHERGVSLLRIAMWNGWQTDFPNKRRFTNRYMVKHCLNARELGYPKVSGYKVVRKMVRSG